MVAYLKNEMTSTAMFCHGQSRICYIARYSYNLWVEIMPTGSIAIDDRPSQNTF